MPEYLKNQLIILYFCVDNNVKCENERFVHT